MKRIVLEKLKKSIFALAALSMLGFGGIFVSCSDSDDGETSVVTKEGSEAKPEKEEGNEESKNSNEKISIIMCGDSITQTYAAGDKDQCGWGQELNAFFDSNVTVDNSISRGGRSSKSFYYEDGRWNKVKELIKAKTSAGIKTYVFINFGHNDESKPNEKGGYFMSYASFADTNPEGWQTTTYTKDPATSWVSGYNPETNPNNLTYKEFLGLYIDEAKELGAEPVIISPFVRLYTNSDGTIREDGAHNITSAYSGEALARGNYAAAAKAIAAEKGVSFIDLTAKSKAFVEASVKAKKQDFMYIQGDSTHERTLGALKICEAVIESVKEIAGLKNHVADTKARVLVDAGSLNFGGLTPNFSDIKSFKVSAFNANDGEITITAPTGYSLSEAQDGEFTQTLKISTTSSFYGTTVYVKFEPTELVEYNDKLSITHTNITPDFGTSPAGTIEGKNLLVTLSGFGKASNIVGGTDVSVTWPMIDDKNKYTGVYTVSPENAVMAREVSLVGLEAASATIRGVVTKERNGVAGRYYDGYAEGEAGCPAYISRLQAAGGGTWPINDGGIALPDVYAQFEVAAGSSLVINKISMILGSSGTGAVGWIIKYSTDKEFSNPVALEKDGVNSNGEYKTVSIEDMGYGIAAGKSLYIRVYPVYVCNTPTKKGQLMIDSVTVEGVTN